MLWRRLCADLVRAVEQRGLGQVRARTAQSRQVPGQWRPPEQRRLRRGVPVPERQSHEPDAQVPLVELIVVVDVIIIALL